MINIFKTMINILDIFANYNTKYMNLYSRIASVYNFKLPAYKNPNNKLANILVNNKNDNINMQENKLYNLDDAFKNRYLLGVQDDINTISKAGEYTKLALENYYNNENKQTAYLHNVDAVNTKPNIYNIYSRTGSKANVYNSLHSYKNLINPISNVQFMSGLNNIGSEAHIGNNSAVNYKASLNDTNANHTIKYINNKEDIKDITINYFNNDTKNFAGNNYYDAKTYNDSHYNTNEIDINEIIQLLKQELSRELHSSAKGVY